MTKDTAIKDAKELLDALYAARRMIDDATKAGSDHEIVFRGMAAADVLLIIGRDILSMIQSWEQEQPTTDSNQQGNL